MGEYWKRRREQGAPVVGLRRDGGLSASRSHQLELLARKAYRTRLGDIVRVAVPVLLGIYPGVYAFGMLQHGGWLAAWIVGFVGNEMLNIYLRGLATDKGRDRMQSAATDLAGNIENFAQLLVSSHGRRLTEHHAKTLCVGYLARIQNFAERACVERPEVQIRATLAVPVGPAGRPPTGLRTWCYDRPYRDRRWSTISMAWEGSPEAFQSGRERIIIDVERLASSAETRDRPFRSVFCIPVTAGGENGKRLAVVNVDASEPGFFTPDRIKSFRGLISPAVSMIAVTLLTMQEDASYEFSS